MDRMTLCADWVALALAQLGDASGFGTFSIGPCLVIHAPPCVFPQWFCVENMLGSVIHTPP
jgi:hypothetical protein